ncbi:MAG: hypothetical protein ABF811_08465 [Pseudoclavibacter sp.]
MSEPRSLAAPPVHPEPRRWALAGAVCAALSPVSGFVHYLTGGTVSAVAAVAFWVLAAAGAAGALLALRGDRAAAAEDRDPLVAPLAVGEIGTVAVSVFIGALLLILIASLP